jgi:hypothetical protein
MPVVTLTHTFASPPSELFAVIAAVDRQPDWNPATLSARRLDSGPTRVGSRFALELRGMGGYEVEVTDLAPLRRLRLASRMAGSEGSHLYLLQPHGSGTQLEQVLELRPTGWRALLSPLMALMLRRNLRLATEALDRHLARQSAIPLNATARI